MKNMKRLPPILFPVWLFIVAMHYTVRILMWLVGFWWCDDCGKRGNLKSDRYDIKYSADKYNPFLRDYNHQEKVKHVCGQCYVEHYADSKENVKYMQSIGKTILEKKDKMTSIGH